MYFISHRGNLNGPNSKKENSINYINNALNQNFEVEIDLWFEKNNFYLGHDSPKYKFLSVILKKQNYGYMQKI